MIVLVKRIFRKIAAPFSGLIHDLFGKYHCNVCHTRVSNFRLLSFSHYEDFEEYGYGIGSAITCNGDQDTCSRHRASDIDKLYAIYVRQFIGRQLGLDSETLF